MKSKSSFRRRSLRRPSRVRKFRNRLAFGGSRFRGAIKRRMTPYKRGSAGSKKHNSFIYLFCVAVLAVAGFFGYKHFAKHPHK